MKYRNEKRLNFAEYIFSFFLVLQASSVWNVSIKPEFYLLPLTTLFCIYLWLKAKNYFHTGYFLNKISWGIMAISIIYLLLTWEKGFHNIVIGIFIIGIPLLTDYFLLCFKTGRDYELFYKIEYIVYILSIISLVLWITGPILGWLNVNCIMTNCFWGGKRSYEGYFYLLFKAQQEDGTFLSTHIWRNSSIFAEAPMFNLWLMICISIELFLRTKIIWKHLIIFIISVLTAFSTTGTLFIIICILLKLYNKIFLKEYKSAKIVNLLFLLAGSIGGYYMITLIITLKSSTNSYIFRMRDYESAMMFIGHNSFLGTGYGNLETLVKNLNTTGFSNGIMAILITGGIYITFIFFFPILMALIKGVHRNHKTISSLAICYLYIFTTVLCINHYWIAVCTSFFYAKLITSSTSQKLL